MVSGVSVTVYSCEMCCGTTIVSVPRHVAGLVNLTAATMVAWADVPGVDVVEVVTRRSLVRSLAQGGGSGLVRRQSRRKARWREVYTGLRDIAWCRTVGTPVGQVGCGHARVRSPRPSEVPRLDCAADPAAIAGGRDIVVLVTRAR